MIRFLFLIYLFLACAGSYAQTKPTLIPYNSDGKWGYSDTNGKIIIPPTWDDEVDFFSNQQARVRSLIVIDQWTMRSITGIINEKGEYILPLSRKWTGWWSDEELRLNTIDSNGKWGVIDSNNHLIIPYQYDDPGNQYYGQRERGPSRYFSKEWNTRFLIVAKNGQSGVISKDNRVLIPFEYATLYAPSADADKTYFVAQKTKNGKWGVIDIHNKIVLPFEYNELHFFNFNTTQYPPQFNRQGFSTRSNSGSGWKDYPGPFFIPAIYQSVGILPDSNVIVTTYNEENKKLDCNYALYGLLGKNGKFIIPMEWCHISYKTDSFICSRYIAHGYDSTTHEEMIYYPSTGKKIYKPHFTFEKDNHNYSHYRNNYSPYENGFNDELRINSNHTRSFDKDGFHFEPEGNTYKIYYSNTGYYFIVRAREADTTQVWYAVVDTGLNYKIAPQKQYAILSGSYINNILTVKSRNGHALTDTNLKILLQPQPLSIDRYHKWKGKLYGIHVTKENYHTTQLIADNGKILKGFKYLTIIKYLDSVYHESYSDFTGHFLVLDDNKKAGIMDITGNVILPNVSFKHNYIKLYDPKLILVSDDSNAVNASYRNEYMVDSNNNIIFPGTTIGPVWPQNNGLYKVAYQTGHGGISNQYFYMSKNGMVYADKIKLIR